MPFVYDRIRRLAILRELQVNGGIDVPIIRKRLQASPRSVNVMSGFIQVYVMAGGLIGIEQGADPDTGRRYKRWKVDDIGAIRSIIKARHLPLMPPTGKECLRARQGD